MQFIQKIIAKRRRFDLFWQLVKTNFKMRYQNSILGVLWVVIKPYVTFLVIFYVWSSFGRGQSIENYNIYLLLGIISYTYFQELVIFGQLSLLERASIILKINFPRQIAVSSALMNALINLSINFSIAFILMLFSQIQINLIGILYFFLVIFVIFIYGLALSFVLSIFTIRFRDLKNIIELILYLLFWLSPVVYRIDTSGTASILTRVLEISPISYMLSQIRASFGIYGEINFGSTIMHLLFAIFLIFISWTFFSRRVKKVAEFF